MYEVGQAFNNPNSENNNKDILPENIRGILLAETSSLALSEFASVSATSGTTSAEGESLDNSLKLSHLVDACSTWWCDAALAVRVAKARNTEAMVEAVGKFDLSGLSEAASHIEHATFWTDVDQQNDLSGDGDEDYHAYDVYWYTTMMTICQNQHTQWLRLQMTQSFLNNLMATWKTLMHPHLKCIPLSRVKSIRCHFPVVDNGAFDDSAQPSIDRKLARSRGMGKKSKKKRMTSPFKWKVSKPWYTWSFAKNTDLTFGTSSTNVEEASDRNLHNSWWATSRSTATSSSVHAVSPSWASCIRMSQQKTFDCIGTKQTCIWCLWSGMSFVRCSRRRSSPE